MPPYFPPEEYDMCSKYTQDLALIYINYIQGNCCNDEVINFYPLLDRIVDWMDDTYGEVEI